VLGHRPAVDDLSRFAEWYLTDPTNLPVKIPADRAIHAVEGLHGVVLYRAGRFQVQLLVCAPNVKIPPHAHPNVDSYEVSLDGGIDFVIAGRRTIPLKVLARRMGGVSAWSGFAVRVRPGVVHWANVGPEGGAFMSIQHWPEGMDMSSVGHDWDGEATMGPKHSEDLQR
jgi:hypothetical protein